ncbi:transposase [Roseovarius sp. MBR-78]|jgi:transposase|uniref:IS5 family transposase n=1 Tax=Roseovarius sp. MBR-78 TaxID=3156460 RepID=UPI003394E838
MNEQRFVVTDRVWQRLEPHLPGKASDAGATAKDNRLFLEAVFWRVRTGSPWRDLPPAFGNWNSQFRRFRRWAKAGIFERHFQCHERRPRSRIRAHRRHHRSGSPEGIGRKRGTQAQAIARSRGGLTTKIVALVDALGNLVRFLLLHGQAHDMKGVAPLIRDVSFGALLADKAFDANWLLEELDERGATAFVGDLIPRIKS